MPQEKLNDLAAFILRIALGVMFLLHSVYYKWMVYTLDGTVGYFEGIGLPGTLAYIVFTMEAVGGTMLVLGIQTRWAALMLTPILFGVIWAHTGDGKLEYPIYLTILAIVQVMLGDGKFALIKSWPLSRFMRLIRPRPA